MKKFRPAIILMICLCLCIGHTAYAAPVGDGVDAYAWDSAPMQISMPQPKQLVGYIETEIGRAKTYYETNAAQANRNENMRLATVAINSVVVQPGEVFSYNRVVGPRTEERGFKIATVFQGKKKVPGLGGGICQISSTLYMATKQTNLKVVERHEHSLPVTYCSRDDEATVSWGYLDYRFQNNFDIPIRIEANMGSGVCNIAIWAMTPVYE